MNILDLLLAFFLLLGLARGLFKGFFMELAALCGLVGGLYAAVHLHGIPSSWLEALGDWNPTALYLVSFGVTFFAVALVISLIGRILTKLVHMVALGFFNRLAGGALGLLKMALIMSFFFLLLNTLKVGTPSEETKSLSRLYAPVEALAPLILPSLLVHLENEEATENQP